MKSGFRKLKGIVLGLLREPDFASGLAKLLALPPRQAVNPLFSFLYSGEPEIRWRASTALGAVIAHLADTEMESARVIMRRLMWNLNDESGGIGWGSPEAMGEAVARHPRLAEEYASIVVFYLRPDGNYLEHEGLQEGVLWATGRMAEAINLSEICPFLLPFLESENAALRGMASWALGNLKHPKAIPLLKELQSDPAVFQLWLFPSLFQTTVGREAAVAMEKIGQKREVSMRDKEAAH